MQKSLIFIVIILLASVFFSGCSESKTKTTEETKSVKYIAIDCTGVKSEISNEGWSVYKSAKVGDTLIVTYTDEMSMTSNNILCNVVWENKATKQYKLTSPWIEGGVVLHQSNLLSMEVNVK